MQQPISVIFDCNIWISFSMGGRIKHLETLLPNPQIKILTCKNLLEEFDNVVQKPNLQKYLKPERVKIARTAIRKAILPFKFKSTQAISRDPKDDYLLLFSEKYAVNYLVTGDKDLLVLKQWYNTQILTFSEFIIELDSLKLT